MNSRGGRSSPNGSASGASGNKNSEDDSDFDSDDEYVLDGRRRADPEHDYVLTAPPHTVRLNPTDRLYVIATTDWAWINVPEMIELRKTSAVICLQRQFRARKDRQKELKRDEKLAEFAGRAGPEETTLSQITFRKRRGSQGHIVPLVDLSVGGRDSAGVTPGRSPSPSLLSPTK